MLVEVKVAASFVTSLLYDKLPRRRVNIFGEELEKALREKFVGHWYPEAPEKGSGFRCIKVGHYGDPADPILNLAAVNSGMDISTVVDVMPKQMTLWIDPGEVSYKVGDKNQVQILFADGKIDDNSSDDSDSVNSFNPDFSLVESVYPFHLPKSISPDAATLSVCSGNTSPIFNPKFPSFKNDPKSAAAVASPCPSTGFPPRSTVPAFTTATFAQTKFGSTKLKTNSKRSNRMSPVEFSNYIKQRSQMQQQQQMQQNPFAACSLSPRAISPPPPPQQMMRPYSHDNNHFFGPVGSFNPYRVSGSSLATAGGSPNDGLNVYSSPFYNQNANFDPNANDQKQSDSGASSFLDSMNTSAAAAAAAAYPYQQLLLAN